MRSLIAALLDAIAAALLGFGAFRLADSAVPCTSQATCAPLAPTVILAILAVLALYFGGSYALWRATPGQKLLSIEKNPLDI